MKWSKYIILLLSLPVFVTSSCNSRSESTPVLTSEDYLIYSTIIDKLSSSLKCRLAIVSDSTLSASGSTPVTINEPQKYKKHAGPGIGKQTPLLSNSIKMKCPGLDFEFFKPEFERNNGSSSALILDSIRVSVCIEQNNNDSIYPAIVRKGYAVRIWFSRIAFNRQHDEAIVYLDYICGDGCGAGEWWWLKKSEGSWKLACPISQWAY